jgi:hypothetical protein
MAVSFTGKPPVVVVSSSKNSVKQPINLQATKVVLVGALAVAVNHLAASQKIDEATFSLAGDTLEIQTNLSATLLHMLFNAEAMHLLESALVERGAGNIKIKLLPALADEAASGSPTSGMVSAPFKRLVDSAAKLNKVSDQLTTQIEQIDAALRPLNLGVTAWVTITESSDEDGNWTEEKLGYVRIGSRWGVALLTRTGMRGDPNEPEETFSAFADAPRQLRIRAVPHIPKLIDQLSVEAEAMIAKLSPEVEEVSALALALQALGVKK